MSSTAHTLPQNGHESRWVVELTSRLSLPNGPLSVWGKRGRLEDIIARLLQVEDRLSAEETEDKKAVTEVDCMY